MHGWGLITGQFVAPFAIDHTQCQIPCTNLFYIHIKTLAHEDELSPDLVHEDELSPDLVAAQYPGTYDDVPRRNIHMMVPRLQVKNKHELTTFK